MNEQTFFITANAYMKRNILQSARMAELLIDVLYSYRKQDKFLLHDFVVMPDHLHAIISPSAPIKKAGQFIKGGFSFRQRNNSGTCTTSGSRASMTIASAISRNIASTRSTLHSIR